MPNHVLIGAADTIGSLSASIDAIPGHPAPIGCVLVREEPCDLPADRLLGTLADLPRLKIKHDLDAALVCLPAYMTGALEQVRAACRSLGIEVKLAPFVGDALTWRAPADASDVVGLLGRRPRLADARRLDAVLKGKRVLITGAGGSIGSELARLAAARDPELLVLMERSENALFEIDQEIAGRFPNVARRAVMHDVVDSEGTLRLFERNRPHTVFHAAAHKHVPMMEDHPAHAVNNNLFGAKSAADAAMQTHVERFVLISTDKAVNPSSVMGSTKRLAEQYVRGMNQLGGPRFCMVRFGNVLGSSGSVLTVWRRQIRAGGPVTVTHPEMTRYFMTIPEAASLVIQAAALDPAEVGGADVFVLDMGEPIRILDLARRTIEAHGLTAALPDEPAPRGPSMPVIFSGVRPGEKLNEELAHDAERLHNTPIGGIMAWQSWPPAAVELHAMTLDMAAVRFEPRSENVLEALKRWTPSLRKQAPAEPATTVVVRDLAARVC